MHIRNTTWLGYGVLILGLSSLVYLCMQLGQRSAWNKERLLRAVLEGTPTERMRAAATLAYLRGENQLFRVLKSDSESARDVAQRALEYCWFTAAGPEPYALLQKAVQRMKAKEPGEAGRILNELTRNYPDYAEGWNQRAALHCEQGEYQLSMADCRRVLELNPRHYGAWQGLGVCQLRLGQIAEACRCLRTALELIPHDQATRRALNDCEELLQETAPRPRQFRQPEFLREARMVQN